MPLHRPKPSTDAPIRRFAPGLLLCALLFTGGCATLGNGFSMDSASDTAADATADKDNMSAIAHERIADGMAARGQSEVALTNYNKALAKDPANGQLRFKKAALLDRQGAFDTALSEYMEIIQRSPKTRLAGRAHEAAALLLFKAEMHERGAEHARQALELDPTLWRAHLLLGVAHNYGQRPEMAETEFRKALELQPENPEVLNNLGMTYTLAGRKVEAVKTLARALRSARPGPEESRIANNLGLALCAMNRFDEALDAFKRAGGGEAKALNNVGYYLYRNGLYRQALGYFEQAIATAPSFYEKAADNLERARLALRVEDAVRDSGKAQAPITPPKTGQSSRTDAAKAEKTAPGTEERSFPALAPPSLLPSAPAKKDELDARAITPATPAAFATEGVVRPVSSALPTATGVVPPTSASAVLPGYTVHVSSWHTLEAARRHQQQLRNAGEQAWVSEVDLGERGRWVRVYVGAFTKSDAAVATRDRLNRELHTSEARVVCPEVFVVKDGGRAV